MRGKHPNSQDNLKPFKKGESGKRADGNIGFTVKREGNVVGEHFSKLWIRIRKNRTFSSS